YTGNLIAAFDYRFRDPIDCPSVREFARLDDRANVFIAESDGLLRSPESVILIHHQECRIRVVWYPGFRVERVALESSTTVEFGIIRSHPTRDIEAESHRLYQTRFRRNRIDMPAPRIFLRVAVTPQSRSEIYQIVLQIPTAV